MSLTLPRVPRSEYLSSHLKVIRHMAKAYHGFQQRFGEAFIMRLVNRNVIVTTSAEHARHILVRNQRNYVKDFPTKVVGRIIGNGILTSDGEYWLRQRRLVQPAFHKHQLQNLSRLMVAETQDFVDMIRRKQEPQEVFSLMVHLTLNVVSRSLFSTGIDEKGLKTVEQSVDSLMELAMARIRNPIQEMIFKLNGKMKHFNQCQQDLDDLIYGIIDTRKAEGVGNNDILDMLLTSKDADTGAELTREQLKDELLVLFLAGHETSANALTWIMLLLEKHPEVQEKMRSEIEEVLGDEEIGFAHLPRLTYIKQVIDEGLRLYPSAWIIGRDAVEADNMEGIDIEAGQQVSVFIYGLHRNPAYWDDPEKFDPDRFSPENSKERPSHAYLPFGGGPRLCIGHQFAVFEMQIALALILREFNFERTDSSLVPSEAAITLRPNAPLKMKFIPR